MPVDCWQADRLMREIVGRTPVSEMKRSGIERALRTSEADASWLLADKRASAHCGCGKETDWEVLENEQRRFYRAYGLVKSKAIIK